MGKISLNCIVCKEQVEFSSNVISFDCSSCNTSLSVQASNDIIYLIPMNQGKKDMENASKRSEIILIEQEVARLDREWILKKDKFPEYLDVEPRKKVIDKIVGAIIIIPILGLGICFIVSDPSFRFYGTIGIFTFICFVLHSIREERRFEKVRQEYLHKREKMMRKLKQMKNI